MPSPPGPDTGRSGPLRGLRGSLDRLQLGRLVRRAALADAAGDWPAAAAHYAQALALDPDRPELLVRQGHALEQQGLLHRAERCFRRAAGLATQDPDRAEAHLRHGQALAMLGWTAEAAGDLPAAGPAAHRELALLLEAHDLTTDVASVFDPGFYAAQAARQGFVGVPAERSGGLAHFARRGLEALLPVGPGQTFDAAFYQAGMLPGSSLPAMGLYRHWLNIGLRGGAAPNKRRWLDQLASAERPDPATEALLDREAERPGTEGLFGWWFDAGRADPEVGVGRFVAIAERLAEQDRADEALRLVQRIVQRWPHCIDAQLARATALRVSGQSAEAAAICAALLRQGEAPPRAYELLASCQEDAGDLGQAAATLAEAMIVYPRRGALQRRFDGVAERWMDVVRREAEADALAGRLGDGRARIAAMLERLSAALARETSLAGRPIQAVAVVGDGDLPQSRAYRIDQKLEQFGIGGIEARYYDHRTGVERFTAEIGRYQAVIFFRVPASYAILRAVHRARDLGLVTIYEIDDLLFDAAHDPLPESDGASVASERWGPQLAVPSFAHVMTLCDIGLAPTAALAGHMRPLVRSGHVFVHRSGVGRAHERLDRAAPLRRGDAVTILYGSGHRAHTAEARALVEGALVELVRRHGDRVGIVLTDPAGLPLTLETIRAHVAVLDRLPRERLWALLPSVDINLAVRAPSVASDCDSETEWLEAALAGVPSVVSDTATFDQVIEPGVTGFLCATPEEWLSTLDTLVGDAALRRRVGAQARAHVRDAYSLDSGAATLARVFEAIGPAPVAASPVVLVVDDVYLPDTGEEAVSVVHESVRELRARHADTIAVEVVTSFDSGTEAGRLDIRAYEGIRLTGIGAAAGTGVDDPAVGEAFGRVLAEVRPDLIHFHRIRRLTVAVVEAAKRLAIPYVITAHDEWWLTDEPFRVDASLRVAACDDGDPVSTLRQRGPEAFDRMLRLQSALTGARRVITLSDAAAARHRRCVVGNVVAIPTDVPGAVPGLFRGPADQADDLAALYRGLLGLPAARATTAARHRLEVIPPST